MESIHICSIGFCVVWFFCEDAGLRVIMYIHSLFISEMEQVEYCLVLHLIFHASLDRNSI